MLAIIIGWIAEFTALDVLIYELWIHRHNMKGTT